MKSLLNFIYRFHYTILFLFLETIALILLVQYNDYQKSSFLNSSSSMAGKAFNTSHSISQYFGLRSEIKLLNASLAKYREHDKLSFKNNQVKLIDIYDSVYIQQYELIASEVINNSVNKQNNFITINAGLKQGVDRGMAVVAHNGVVGIVKDVSDNFASVISLLNHNLRISAMIKRTGYYGSLVWEGVDYTKTTLIDLPSHLTVNIGDTIITSGYSAMFPKGEIIGIVSDVKGSHGGDFLEVVVDLSVDFKSISDVLVINNLLKEEQLKLEQSIGND